MDKDVQGMKCPRTSEHTFTNTQTHIMHITKPRPKPDPSSADVAERRVVSIGVRSSENLCVEEEYAQGEAGAQSTTYE